LPLQEQLKQTDFFKLIFEFLKISKELHTILAAGTYLAEGQWLEEQKNRKKIRMFREGTRIPTVSTTEEQFLAPLLGTRHLCGDV
jgi:hypothetical protein